MKKILLAIAVCSLSALTGNSQILLSGGLTYSQNFDSLGSAPVNTNPTWTDNTTLSGWYASRAFTGGTATPLGPYSYTSYRIDAGTATSGLLYSYGVAGVNAVTDRGLGSLSSGTPKTNVFGLRIANDTASAVDAVTISYTGEQWRNANVAAHTLAFAYRVSGTPFASPIPTDSVGWTSFSSLDFVTPIIGGAGVALDGNAPANTVFSSVVLTGVTLSPGEEIFFRWLDFDDSGSDHGFAVDDFAVSFSSVSVPEPTVATLGGLAALGLIMARRTRK
jgi:hypothetical protein